MKNKERLDIFITERGFAETRNRAQALIMAGKVRVKGQTVTKSGTLIPLDLSETEIEVDAGRRWASRGAYKLLGAFEAFPDLKVEGRTCADIGASTGGFTDVLLEKGARKIYAVDVGYGQLLWRLASDSRVVVMDRTNARNLTAEDFDDPVSLVTCDASFISLRLLLPALDGILPEGPEGEAVVLIKPQFEAGRERLGSRGVVRDPRIHADILREITAFIAEKTRFFVSGLTCSPILGPEGNREFLCYLTRDDRGFLFDPSEVVGRACQEQEKK